MKYKDGIYTKVTAVKNGVETVVTPAPEIVAAWFICDEVSKRITGKEIVITSILDGKHKDGSLHYLGRAFDLRRFIYTPQQLTAFIQEIKRELGKHFDVVLEIDHIHIEYDPKN